MENELILVDTSILIDFYRKSNKANTTWIKLVRRGYRFAISSITKFEIYSGATQDQIPFWDNVLNLITILPFDEGAVGKAVEVNEALKKKSKQIDLADLFIAATALVHDLSIATLNRKHFDRIEILRIVEE